jgi:predicted ATPase
LVGRDTESALGTELLTQAASRHGAMLVVTGGAGVGKSRLTQGLIETATWRGFQHVVGYCHERDRDLPYAPFLDALHAMVQRREKAEVARLLGAERAILARLLPALAADDTAFASLLAPEHEKGRIFDAFVALFMRFAVEAPLLLVIEAIHWADEATLDVLRLLTRRLAHAPVLTIVTVRFDEPDAGLVHWLDYLDRNRLVTRVNLAPLSAPAETQMIAAMSELPPPPATVRSIQPRAEGNPPAGGGTAARASTSGRSHARIAHRNGAGGGALCSGDDRGDGRTSTGHARCGGAPYRRDGRGHRSALFL